MEELLRLCMAPKIFLKENVNGISKDKKKKLKESKSRFNINNYFYMIS